MHAFLAGAVAVFGFAPFGIFPLPIFALAMLFWLWSRSERPAQAAWLGFSFGMGLFCIGIGWIYVALHEYGDMHAILAAVATILFAAVIAALPALAGYAQANSKLSSNVRILLLMPAYWVLAEWVRGLLFTGFPWLVFGYSQVPDSPLVGYAPLLGVYGVSLVLAVTAALILVMWNMRWSKQGKFALGVLCLLLASGGLLHNIAWTQPQGEPIKVSLLQGNIEQELKFDESKLVDTLETYRRLAQSSNARLVIMPETAIPLLRVNMPEIYQTILRNHAIHNGGDILIGIFEREQGKYFNSLYTLGTSPSQHYYKDHLVPFGEFIPLRGVFGWFINEVLHIPMSDLARGGATQPPLEVAGQKVAANICYEDAFGEEIIRALPEATLLVNVTNDAWYGDTNAAAQHNQLSQMRALETGRMMLRSTNTGVTSIIRVNGQVQAMLPQHEQGVLNGEVQGYVGSTPYVRWGNAAVLVILILMLFVAWRINSISAPSPMQGEG
jgi:apolipoprotein N-acyltransferase